MAESEAIVPGAHGLTRQKTLELYDADGDGKLDHVEEAIMKYDSNVSFQPHAYDGALLPTTPIACPPAPVGE